MDAIRFFDLLGVGGSFDAAELWPRENVQSKTGFLSDVSDPQDFQPLMEYLQNALTFRALRPAAAPELVDPTDGSVIRRPATIGLSAEVVIKNPVKREKLVLASMPDIAFLLQDTPDPPDPEGYRPARLYVTAANGDVELIIEGLPVEIQIPSSLLGALGPEEGGGALLDDEPLTPPFAAGVYDSLAIILRDLDPTSIFVHIRLRMTAERDFIIEPAVPISIGPCRFNGLPCLGLHDLNLVPSPVLRGDHSAGEQALDWPRHSLDPIGRIARDALYNGVMTVRSVDLNSDRTPLKQLREQLNDGKEEDAQVEFVLEDIALPFWNFISPLPLPTHALFGLRRKIEAGDDIEEAFNFDNPPFITVGDYRLIFEQLLLRTPATLVPLDQFLFLKMALLRDELFSDEESVYTIGIDDHWTLQFGWQFPEGRLPIVFADAEIRFWGVKFGVSIERIVASYTRHDDPDVQALDWYNFYQLLFDLSLKTEGTDTPLGLPFKLRSLSGKNLEIPIRDFGWDSDAFTVGNLAFPEGVQVIFGASGFIRLIIEEVGWVMDPNGARYFSVSGGVTFGQSKAQADREMDAGEGSAAISEDNSNVGIRFHRLRWRTGGNPDAPGFLLDGITLALRFGSFSLVGFGMISRRVQDGHVYNEKGFGLKISFQAGGTEYLIGADLFFGDVSGPVDNFHYWLVSAIFSPIPLTGSVSFVNIRALLANDLTPDLPPPDGHDQNMRLFRWYKDNVNAVNLPGDRKLAAWRPESDAWAFGIGLGLSFGGQKAVTIDGFFFLAKAAGEKSMLLAFEVFVGGGTNPVGWGVLEYDDKNDIWHVLFGVALSLADVLPEGAGGVLGNLASLTGTLYIGNRPGTIALGQLNDQTTWLSLRFKTGGPFETDVLVAYCFHLVDAPQGPFGTGLIISVKGGGSFGIGKVQVYGSFGFILGAWRNESKAMGLLAFLEAGFRIKVFWVFTFGASAKVEFDFLGPDPTYRRLGVELRIETPWYMPDATFRFERIKNEPQSEQLDLVSCPIVSAEAVEPGTQRQTAVLVGAPGGGVIDEQAVFSMDQLRAFDSPPPAPDGLDGLDPVATDSAIALNFKPSVDDLTTVGEVTPAGAGTQSAVDPAANDLSLTYELVEIGIRRRPRFGPDSDTFTTLLAPEDSQLEGAPESLPDAESDLSFLWDKDIQRLGRWDPRRLLINASTPYTFVTANPEADEALLRAFPAWPCCLPDEPPRWHELDFSATPPGLRVPSFQHFSDSSSALHWIGALPPFVRPGLKAPAASPAAVVDFMRQGDGLFAAIHFDRPALACEIFAFWFPHSFSQALIIEVYNGLEQIDSLSLALGNPNPAAPLLVTADSGMTAILLRRLGKPLPADPQPEEARTNWIEFTRLRYLDLRKEKERDLAGEKCRVQGDRALNGGGKLAWLPNQVYEISVATRINLAHEKTEPQTAAVQQKILFQTKGLPGLNAVARTGDELEPFVESRYPGPAPQTLYRAEPLLLAFNEKFNILLPLDGQPQPDAPLERQQILEWVLAVEQMGNATDGQRITQTSPDWIVANRTLPLPPLRHPAFVLDGAIARTVVRQAPTRNPFHKRLENFLHRSQGCDIPRPLLHDSQVLIHEPRDPNAAQDAPHRWAARSVFRANVRRKDAPFVERRPFDSNDFTAFDFANDGSTIADPWRVTAGAMHVQGSPADNVRRLALFGDQNWNHVQIYSTVDPAGGRAGLAVGVSGAANALQALLVLVDETAGRLRISVLRAGALTELASEPLAEGASAPYMLQLLAYDDRLRARVGDTVVEAPRDTLRAGRLALVAQRGGSFQDLVVEPLDAYRFYFQSSRYVDFEAHIGSFNGELNEIAFSAIGQDDPSAVAALLTATSAEITDQMSAAADIEQRQRLFDQWLQTLQLPLSQKPRRLALSRVIDDGGMAHLLLLESPEPLPFSKDVSLALTQRVFSVDLPPDFPAELLELAQAITFQGPRFEALLGDQALQPILGATRRLVRATAQGNNRLRFDVYRVTFSQDASGALNFSGQRTQRFGPFPPNFVPNVPLLRNVRELRANQFALLDDNNELVRPQMIPIVTVTVETIPVQILTNGAETTALIIPTLAGQHRPLAGGRYQLAFTLDRARFRAHAPDDDSNYRAAAELEIQW